MTLLRARTCGPAVALLAVTTLAGCGGGSKTSGDATLGTGGGHPAAHRLTDASNGSTLHARVGDTISVLLHSTYWQLTDPRDGELAPTASPVASPGGKGCPTIPGTGCGTMSAGYRVATAGTTTLAATRQSCGEAMRCTGSQGRWSVKVVATR
jgi:hypothetical protein